MTTQLANLTEKKTGMGKRFLGFRGRNVRLPWELGTDGLDSLDLQQPKGCMRVLGTLERLPRGGGSQFSLTGPGRQLLAHLAEMSCIVLSIRIANIY